MATTPGCRLRVGWLTGFGAARAEYAQGTPTQSHISQSILVYEEYSGHTDTPLEGEGGDLAYIRQSRPDSGPGVQVQVIKSFKLFLLRPEAGARHHQVPLAEI